MINKLIPLDPQVIKGLAEFREDEVLPGLSKKKYGFIIGAPGSGKGYFCLSLAYEISTANKILGLSAGSSPQKVLYWPVEDGVNTVARRISKHLQEASNDLLNTLLSNMTIYDSVEPICTGNKSPSSVASLSAQNARSELILAAKDFDLLIIDTLREAVGDAHEVDNDFEIKVALQEVAREANVAILASHHPTKDVMRKRESITTVSGSGLSVTQANSRYSLYLESIKNKTYLSHLKHNNVDHNDVLNKALLYWNDDSLLYFHSDIADLSANDFYETEAKLRSNIIIEKEPESLDFTTVIKDDHNISKVNVKNEVNSSVVDEYELFMKKQELDK